MEQIWPLVVLVSFAGVQHFINIFLTNNKAAKTKSIIAYGKKSVVHYNSVSVVVKLFLSSAFSLNLKQPTFCDATTNFFSKCRLRKERKNSILMRCHYSDQSSASDWSCCEGSLLQPIRSTTEIYVVTRHQYGISPLVPGLISFGN